MRIAWLLLLAGCWRSSPPPEAPPTVTRAPAPMRAAQPACDRDAWRLMRALRQCHDYRGGYSGFWVLEIVDGPDAGKSVFAYYGEGARSHVAKWNLSKAVTFGTVTPQGSWPNACTHTVAGGQPMTYDASVNTLEPNMIDTFEDEAAARAALETRC